MYDLVSVLVLNLTWNYVMSLETHVFDLLKILDWARPFLFEKSLSSFPLLLVHFRSSQKHLFAWICSPTSTSPCSASILSNPPFLIFLFFSFPLCFLFRHFIRPLFQSFFAQAKAKDDKAAAKPASKGAGGKAKKKVQWCFCDFRWLKLILFGFYRSGARVRFATSSPTCPSSTSPLSRSSWRKCHPTDWSPPLLFLSVFVSRLVLRT